MLLHSHRQRLHASQHQPALEWRKNRSRRLLHKTKFLNLVRPSTDHDAAKSVAVTVEKLRGRMQHHVRAQRNRLLKIWRHESVVHHQLYLLGAADFADRFDVCKIHEWIGGRFHVHHASLLANGALDISDVSSIDISEFESIAG